MNTIEEHWINFSTMVIGEDAPEVQKQMMRLAFFAGAQSVLDIQLNVSSESVSEDDAIKIIEALHIEAHSFAANQISEIFKTL